MMKKILLFSFALLFISEYNFAQIRIPGKKYSSQGLNLLDDPKFKKAPIQFVPLQPDVRRGYDPEKVYTWSDPSNPRKTYSAKGKDILWQVNEVEKSLNERGHSLREKKPFIQLNLALPAVAKNDFNKCVITNRVNRVSAGGGNTMGNIGTIPVIKPTINRRRLAVTRRVPDVIYTYTGELTSSREFKMGTLANSFFLERKGSLVFANIMMSISRTAYDKINSCTLELSATEDGAPFTAVKMNIKSPANSVTIDDQYNIQYVDCDRPNAGSNSFPLNIYNVNLSSGGYNFPSPTRNPVFYYTTFKFYDAAGQELNIYQPNIIVLNNQLPMPVNVDLSAKKSYSGFNYELLDPGLHAFGFYVNSGGFNASCSKTKHGYDGVNKLSSVSGDMSMGIKYFNFKHLVNGNEPLSNEFVVFGYKLSSERKYNKPDGVPPIVVKSIQRDPDAGVITLMNKQYDLRTTDQTYFEEPINQELIGFRFFIGPIPCSINVNVTGKASMTVNYESVTGPSCDIKTTITPHADANLNASGGVDAFSIAYAKVFANINLLTFDMPYTMQVNAENNSAVIDPKLTVGGLAGQIYFRAGLCIPIPFVDDICTDFRVDILNWNGLEKSLTIDPARGITL
jgi:hypothetical protein